LYILNDPSTYKGDIMKFWFFSSHPDRCRRHSGTAATVRPRLESLEDRSVPSMTAMPASGAAAPSMMAMSATVSAAPSSASTSPPTANAIASLSHDQIHVLQDQSQLQTANATVTLEVEQAVLGILQLFAPQVPQVRPEIALLTNAIPAQQATVATLQNQTSLLNQLDNLQDQSIILSAEIQNATSLVAMLQQSGNAQTANTVQGIIAADQAAVQALQPQIAAVEVEVSAFV
jgi:hypothetical protein